MKALIKTANERMMTVTLANGSAAVVRFEGHVFEHNRDAHAYRVANATDIWAADQLLIDRTMVFDIQTSAVVVANSGGLTGPDHFYRTLLARLNQLERLKVMCFTNMGDGLDMDPLNQELYRYRWDVTPPISLYSKSYLKHLSLLAQSDSSLRSIAWVSLQGMEPTVAMQTAQGMGLRAAMVETVPAHLFQNTITRDANGTWIDVGPDHYWHHLAEEIAQSGAGSVVYHGLYELLSLSHHLEHHHLNLPGSVWSTMVAIDPSFARANVAITQMQFTSSIVVPNPVVPDPLFGSVGAFNQMLMQEFGFGPKDGYIALATSIASVGSILTTVIENYGTIDPEVIIRKVPSTTIPDSIIGTIYFGSHHYLDDQAVQLYQFFDGRLTSVLPVRHAERSLVIPVPQYACRGSCADCPRACSCPPGQVGDRTSMRCETCPPGYESPGGLGAVCTPCRPGFSSSKGASACSPCGNGTFSPRPAAADCHLCSMGMYAASEGQSHCEVCPLGHFAAAIGSGGCESCGPDLTTEGRGSLGPQQCTCPASTYLRPAANSTQRGVCVPCGKGLLCRGGGAPPLQEEGFQVVFTGGDGVVGPAYEAFRCQDAIHCPGGTAVGSCPPHRKDLACEFCEAGMYTCGSGTCLRCDGIVWLEAVVFVCAGLLFLLVFAAIAKASHRVRITFQSRLTVSCCFGIVITTAQIFGTFGGMDLARIPPMSALTTFWQVVSVSLDVIEVTCTLGVTSSLGHYASSMALYPAILLSFVLMFAIVHRGSRRHMDALYDGLGRVFMLVYLPATILALEPFRCGHNPCGRPTLMRHRSVICWEGSSHPAMLAISVVAVLAFPVSFLAFVAQATWAFPRRLASSRCHTWLQWHSFIFQRFKSEHYYYGIAHLSRSFCIGLLPALLVNEEELHILLLGLVLSASGLAQAFLQPWRSGGANMLDVVITIGCCVTLTAAALVFDGSRPRTAAIVENFLRANLALLFGVACAALLLHGWRSLRPPKPYGVFLSHHKGGGGVLARLFKMLISTRIQAGIFLDSDELNNLDHLVSAVAFSSKNVVVLLTKQTLSRIWCALELAAALRPGSTVNVVPVACDDYEIPNGDFLDSLSSHWSQEEITLMAKHGLSVSDVRAAYSLLFREPLVRLQRTTGLDQIEAAVDQALQQCVGVLIPRVSHWRQQLHLSSSRGVKLLIAGAAEDPESLCACYVLQLYFQREMKTEVAVVDCAEALSRHRHATHLVVVLTRNALGSSTVQDVLLASDNLQLVPVQADTAFAFPSVDFYRPLQAKGSKSVQLVERFKELFRTIAFVFSPYASQETQLMEVRAIKRRAQIDHDSSRSFFSMPTASFDNVSPSAGQKECSDQEDQERNADDDNETVSVVVRQDEI